MSKEDDFWKDDLSIMEDALKMKKVMKAKGLRQAKAKCPKCEGYLYGKISSYNGHIHVACNGSCKRSMME